MADTRGLQINNDIYNFELRIFRLYDVLPAKHRHTLSEVLLKSVLDMRHYSNLATDMFKGHTREKARLFSLALGFARDAQDSLNHLYDMGLLSNKQKSSIDIDLYAIREQLSRLVNSFEKQLKKGAVHCELEEANDGDSIIQEEG